MPRIQPKTRHVAIQRGKRGDISPERTSEIIDPRDEQAVTWYGVVIAVGPNTDPAIEDGSRVAFDPMLGREVEWRGKTYVILHEEDILAVVED